MSHATGQTTITGPFDPAQAWAKHAPALAAWTDKRMVNRRDVFGHYVAVEDRKDPKSTAFTDKSGLTLEALQRHFEARNTGDLIGLHSTVRDEPAGEGETAACWSRWGAVDIDLHDGKGNPEANLRFALALYAVALALGFRPLLYDSNGRGGYHLVLVFDGPVPTDRVFAFLGWLTREWKEFGLDEAPETFPKQPTIKPGKFGNWLRQPGRHHTHGHYTRVWDGERWLEGSPAIRHILKTTGTSAKVIPTEALEPPAPPKREGKAARASAWDMTVGSGPRARYIARALADEAANVANATPGGRNHQLNRSAFALGQLIGPELTRGEVERHLEAAAAAAQLGGAETTRTIASGIDAGILEPRNLDHVGRTNGQHQSNGNGTPRQPPPDEPSPGRATDDELARRPRTDLGNAERLVARHGQDMRYCHPWHSWLVWDGRHWKADDTGGARRHARDTVRAILGEAQTIADDDRRKDHAQWALTSEKRDKIAAMLHLAEAELGIPILPKDMDSDPWAFNCRNGTIDLKTGRLRPHRRSDLITKLCDLDYDPDAKCPLWDATLGKFFARECRERQAALTDFWQRVCGYSMTGVVRDQVMPVAWGLGSNGKSTILGTLMDALGPDYAMKCPPDLLMAKKNDGHPTDRATLFGKRLVVAIETESGRRLNETMVKELTGNDPITARRMREDFWTFKPTHTLIMATNHKPVIRGTDKGIWRRLKLVPFTVSVEDAVAIMDMPERLRAEWPGILAWCVRGCLEWQRRGLDAPEEVVDATAGYRAEQDVIGLFLKECTMQGPNFKAKAGQLYARYKAWAEAGNEHTMSHRLFSEALQERGIETKRSNGIWHLGIGLVHDEAEAESDREGGVF